LRIFPWFISFSITAAALGTAGCGSHSKPGPCPDCPQTTNHSVYVANEGGNQSTVSVLASDATTGVLTPKSGSPYNTGSGSMALAKNPLSGFIYVANNLSGNISGFSINSSTGALTPVPGSPFTAEIGVDSLTIDPQGGFLYAASEQSANLWIFSINSNGSLGSVGGSPMLISSSGSESSSVVVDPTGKYLYVITGSPVGIYGFSRNATTGGLTQLVGFPVPANGQANQTTFNPSGKFLLVTGTGVFGLEGGLEVFSLNAATGALSTTTASPVQVGRDPAGVVMDSSGTYVYVPNTADSTISAFTMDSSSGSLSSIGGSPFPSGGNGSINGPTGITADNISHFVYVCNASNDVSVFSINASNGALSPIGGSPFPDGGNGPRAILFVP